MPKFLDLTCSKCGVEVNDLFVMRVPTRIIHMEDDGEMEQVYRLRPKQNVQWSDRDAVVVYRKPDGSYSYPGRNDRPTPPGCERIVMRSLREVERFEKQAGVRSEMAWFDKGSGRGHDDTHRGERF